MKEFMTVPQHHILVCVNERPPDNPKGSCKPRGSMELFVRIKEAVSARGLKGKIAVNTTSCLKSCPFGPTVVVWPAGAYYGNLSPDRIDALLDSIEKGEIIQSWLIPANEVGLY
jgi:(2Fe-2S) ferredoxin